MISYHPEWSLQHISQHPLSPSGLSERFRSWSTILRKGVEVAEGQGVGGVDPWVCGEAVEASNTIAIHRRYNIALRRLAQITTVTAIDDPISSQYLIPDNAVIPYEGVMLSVVSSMCDAPIRYSIRHMGSRGVHPDSFNHLLFRTFVFG